MQSRFSILDLFFFFFQSIIRCYFMCYYLLIDYYLPLSLSCKFHEGRDHIYFISINSRDSVEHLTYRTHLKNIC